MSRVKKFALETTTQKPEVTTAIWCPGSGLPRIPRWSGPSLSGGSPCAVSVCVCCCVCVVVLLCVCVLYVYVCVCCVGVRAPGSGQLSHREVIRAIMLQDSLHLLRGLTFGRALRVLWGCAPNADRAAVSSPIARPCRVASAVWSAFTWATQPPAIYCIYCIY